MWNHSLASLCSPEALATPSVFGAEILSLSASWVTNYTFDVPAVFNYNHGDVYLDNVNFCNVTITYTHPGHDDIITVETWLPQRWNKRLQATGGGGWNAGRFVLSEFFMSGAIGEGYAATSTDAGLGESSSPNSWALESPGNVDLYDVQNLGYVSLNDQAVIGKSLVQSFYKQNASYSYWSGCSQGGRQGLMLAQRYPHASDGIAASAPALAWTELAASVYYPLMVKLWAGTATSPLNCEMEFITDEAIAACDADDGLVDGIISNPSACHFDALTVVNKPFNCSSTGKMMRLTNTAALVANAAWSGPQAVSGKPLWFGYNRGADISSLGEIPGAIANTSASAESDLWFRLFVAKDKDFQSAKLTPLEYERFFHRGVLEYAGLMNADSHDLREFKNAGGKLISYHGLVRIPLFPKRRNYSNIISFAG